MTGHLLVAIGRMTMFLQEMLPGYPQGGISIKITWENVITPSERFGAVGERDFFLQKAINLLTGQVDKNQMLRQDSLFRRMLGTLERLTGEFLRGT